MRRLPILLVLCAVGCAREQTPAPAPVLTYTASDFAYTGPAEIPAGASTIRLVNQGMEPHHAVMARVDSGKTLADIANIYAAQQSVDPAWLTFVGGPGVVAPGDTTEITADLEPGTYAFICFVESPDGSFHFMKGMMSTIAVAASDAIPALPTADLQIHLADYTFHPTAPLGAGTHTIHIVNTGPQVHDLQIIKLDAGTTLEMFLAALMPGAPPGPPPGAFVGGIGGLSVGREAYITVTLDQGNYAIVCFVPDVNDGQPHLAHGMIHEFVVE